MNACDMVFHSQYHQCFGYCETHSRIAIQAFQEWRCPICYVLLTDSRPPCPYCPPAE